MDDVVVDGVVVDVEVVDVGVVDDNCVVPAGEMTSDSQSRAHCHWKMFISKYFFKINFNHINFANDDPYHFVL